jgi:probable rRNA maturation factor
MAEKTPEKLSLNLTVQFPDQRLQKQLPKALIKKTVRAALLAPAEFTIRLSMPKRAGC